MLSQFELEILRKNGQIHKKIFEEIRPQLIAGNNAKQIDSLALKLCRSYGVLSAFTGVYGYKYTLQTSINNVVVHGRPLESLVFENGDVVTVDFGVKDSKYGICTDAAFTVIIWDPEQYPERKKFLETGKKALEMALTVARAGNTVGDIGHIIEKTVKAGWYHIVKELTGHGVGKSLHEEPYVYNYGTPGKWPKLKAGMTLAIEPIVGFSSGQIVDKWDWEIYIADGSLGCQFEHTILITEGDPEIIV